MATSPEIRAAAQDERDSLKRTRNSADLAIAGVGVLSVLVAPPLAAVCLIPAVLRWRAVEELGVQERLIEDPPRDDFAKSTEPVYQPFYAPDAVEPWAEPVVDYIEASIAACAYETAMITSVEKALGAQDRNEGRYANERAEEAGMFAASTAEKILGTAQKISPLLRSYERGATAAEHDLRNKLETIDPRQYEIPSSPLQAFPNGVAAWLFRVGAPANVFRHWNAGDYMNLSRHPFAQVVGGGA